MAPTRACATCSARPATGPGSIHVDAEEPTPRSTITLAPPTDLCATECHTVEHSDTFDRTAYLRDVIGPGPRRRRRGPILGDGPTGRELRKAGLEPRPPQRSAPGARSDPRCGAGVAIVALWRADPRAATRGRRRRRPRRPHTGPTANAAAREACDTAAGARRTGHPCDRRDRPGVERGQAVWYASGQ
jgi:hypothetical protein